MMDFEPISTARMIALMIAGGIFAFAGIYMMVRPKPQGSAKIEIFGLKFESSSAGLLVFLIGSAFLAVTLFVPEKRVAARTGEPTPTISSAAEATTSRPASEAQADAASISAVTSDEALIDEIEPNNGIRSAQPIRVGQVVRGEFGKTSGEDWFTVSMPQGTTGDHEVKLTHVTGYGATMEVYDAREQRIGYLYSSSGATYLSLEDEVSDVLYMKAFPASSGSGSSTYEISVQPR